MTDNWQKEYTKLTDFVTQHPEIKIESEYVCLPDEVRPEFYRLFNTVRAIFIRQYLPALLNEAEVLSRNFSKAEEEVRQLMGLEKVSLASPLQTFVLNPMDGLVGVLFDPVFDLLKGKTNAAMLEQGSPGKIEKSFRFIYQKVYEKWVVLSLLKLLEADKLFDITATKAKGEEAARMMFTRPDSAVPIPEESSHLSFKDSSPVMLSLPDFIVHSAKINKYVSFRSDMDKAMSGTSEKSTAREWLPSYYFTNIWPIPVLVYIADNLGEISLIADYNQICRPDLIIQCHAIDNQVEEEGWGQIQDQHNSLKPVMGTLVVSRESLPEHGQDELAHDIKLLTADFDQTRLETVVESLMNSTKRTG